MEAVGLIASAAQISVYAFSIASTIQDIRSAIRNGPTLLQERSQQLDVLSLVVRKIGLDTRLHSDEVARYLVTVQSKILRLNNIIRAGLQTPTKSFLQKLRAATTFINRDKEVEDSFTALQRDCQILNIYVSLPSSTSGGGQRRDISGIISAVENPSNKKSNSQLVVFKGNERTNSLPRTMPPQGSAANGHERPGSSPKGTPSQGGAAKSAPENLDQKVLGSYVTDGADLEAGHHDESLLETIRIKQELNAKMEAKNKGKLRVGCTNKH